MRSRTWISALAGVAIGAVTIAVLPERALFHHEQAHPHEASATGERWACPMMDFIGNKPGDCPVCGMKMQKVTAGELTREQQRRMGIETTVIVQGSATATFQAYGTVRYDDRTAQLVIARVAGRVVKRHPAALHEGTLIKEGDPVIDVYSPEAFAAQGELAAAVALGDRVVIDALTQRFERLNLGEVAKAIIAGGAPVDTVTIKSPFAGRVVLSVSGATDDAAKLPQVGQEVAADTPLVRLVEPHRFMLVVQVPEARAHWVREGQPVQLESDDLGALPEIEASVTWVSPELDLNLRSREVHIHLDDPAARLMAGSLVSARLQATLGGDLNVVDSDGAAGMFPLVPKTAVLSTGVRHVAWRVAAKESDGRLRFELAPLVLGPRLEDEAGNDRYVVRAGLKAGDEVATQGVFLIDSQAQLAGTESLLYPRGAVAPSAHQH